MRGIEHTGYEIDAAIELLETVKSHLSDLHALAYNRHRAAQEVKVHGGDHDYALDTHGDPQARDLLTNLSTQTRGLIKAGTDVARTAVKFLERADVQRVHKRDPSSDASLDEVIAALRNSRHRRLNGEGHATLVAAPVVPKGTDWQTRYETLASAVRKVTTRFAADHRDCVKTDDRGFRRKLSRRYDLSLLTPLERDSWRQSLRDEQNEQAS